MRTASEQILTKLLELLNTSPPQSAMSAFGGKATSRGHASISAQDPKRTSARARPMYFTLCHTLSPDVLAFNR